MADAIEERPEVDETENPSVAEEEFPDPVLDEDVDAPQVAEPAPEPPVASVSPIPPYQPPPTDGGFTPTPIAQQDRPAAPAAPSSEIKFFTTAQLRQGVNEGVITEDQMIEQLQLQNRELAKQEALQAFQQQQQQQTLTQQLNEYRQLVPGWDQPGSPANQQALPAYSRLLGLGLGDNDTTRLLALEQTFGPLARVKEARTARTQTAALRDTSPEVGGRGAPPSSQRKKDPLDLISADEKRVYKTYIDKGVYADWNAVRAEIRSSAEQTVNPRLRDKHAGLMR